MTKIYISADMEGISGLIDMDDVQPHGRDYQAGRELMTADVNAAIRGAFSGGATEVIVNDAHGPMRNIFPEKLNDRAVLIKGKAKKLGMIEGLDTSFDAVVCIGFHAKAGALGVLSHSFMGHEVEDIWLDDVSVGEIGLLQAAAAEMGVPVVMLTGDDIACDEAKVFDSTIATVAVKKAVDRFAGELLPIKQTLNNIEQSTKLAVSNINQAKKLKSKPEEHILRVRWQSASVASHLCGIPGVTSVDDRSIEVRGTVQELYQLLFLFFKVAASMTNQQPYC
jgi:D-amino peptidase